MHRCLQRFKQCSFLQGLLPLQAVDMLSKAHTKLNYVAEQWAGQAPGWAAVQAEGQNSSIARGTTASFPLLSSIMDPGLALERTVQAAQVNPGLIVLITKGHDAKLMATSLHGLSHEEVTNPAAHVSITPSCQECSLPSER